MDVVMLTSRCPDSDCYYAYSTGAAYKANQWYKIDVVIGTHAEMNQLMLLDWSTSSVNLWIDDILRDSNFPLMYGSTTLSARKY